jgi:hypothetical protein
MSRHRWAHVPNISKTLDKENFTGIIEIVRPKQMNNAVRSLAPDRTLVDQSPHVSSIFLLE